MLKKLLLTLTACLAITGLAVAPTTTILAAPADDACAGIEASGGSCDGGDEGFENIIRTIVDILSIVVGAVSVIMIIIGGFRYVVSGGDSAGVSGAKNTILYAVVGLVIVLFAQVIVRFVWTQSTNAS